MLWLSCNSSHFAPSLWKQNHCSVVWNSWTDVDPLLAEVKSALGALSFSLHVMLCKWTFSLCAEMGSLSTDMRRHWANIQKTSQYRSKLSTWSCCRVPQCELLWHCLTYLLFYYLSREAVCWWVSGWLKPCDVTYTIPLIGCWKALRPNKTIIVLWPGYSEWLVFYFIWGVKHTACNSLLYMRISAKQTFPSQTIYINWKHQ